MAAKSERNKRDHKELRKRHKSKKGGENGFIILDYPEKASSPHGKRKNDGEDGQKDPVEVGGTPKRCL